MAGYVELTIEQGANFSTVINVADAAGVAVNLATYTTASQLRKSYASATANTFTTTVTDAAEGEITLSMTAANTTLLKAGRYVYDLTTTSSASVVTRVIEGVITVMPSVTR